MNTLLVTAVLASAAVAPAVTVCIAGKVGAPGVPTAVWAITGNAAANNIVIIVCFIIFSPRIYRVRFPFYFPAGTGLVFSSTVFPLLDCCAAGAAFAAPSIEVSF